MRRVARSIAFVSAVTAIVSPSAFAGTPAPAPLGNNGALVPDSATVLKAETKTLGLLALMVRDEAKCRQKALPRLQSALAGGDAYPNDASDAYFYCRFTRQQHLDAKLAQLLAMGANPPCLDASAIATLREGILQNVTLQTTQLFCEDDASTPVQPVDFSVPLSVHDVVAEVAVGKVTAKAAKGAVKCFAKGMAAAFAAGGDQSRLDTAVAKFQACNAALIQKAEAAIAALSVAGTLPTAESGCLTEVVADQGVDVAAQLGTAFSGGIYCD